MAPSASEPPQRPHPVKQCESPAEAGFPWCGKTFSTPWKLLLYRTAVSVTRIFNHRPPPRQQHLPRPYPLRRRRLRGMSSNPARSPDGRHARLPGQFRQPPASGFAQSLRWSYPTAASGPDAPPDPPLSSLMPPSCPPRRITTRRPSAPPTVPAAKPSKCAWVSNSLMPRSIPHADLLGAAVRPLITTHPVIHGVENRLPASAGFSIAVENRAGLIPCHGKSGKNRFTQPSAICLAYNYNRDKPPASPAL